MCIKNNFSFLKKYTHVSTIRHTFPHTLNQLYRIYQDVLPIFANLPETMYVILNSFKMFKSYLSISD